MGTKVCKVITLPVVSYLAKRDILLPVIKINPTWLKQSSEEISGPKIRTKQRKMKIRIFEK
jgi:hypothetical protein